MTQAAQFATAARAAELSRDAQVDAAQLQPAQAQGPPCQQSCETIAPLQLEDKPPSLEDGSATEKPTTSSKAPANQPFVEAKDPEVQTPPLHRHERRQPGPVVALQARMQSGRALLSAEKSAPLSGSSSRTKTAGVLPRGWGKESGLSKTQSAASHRAKHVVNYNMLRPTADSAESRENLAPICMAAA